MQYVQALLGHRRKLGSAVVRQASATSLDLPDESVDAVVTSPPYSIALNYMENDKHALEELGIDIKSLSEICIGVKGTGQERLTQYEKDMNLAYLEMHRVLKIGAQCVVVIGDATYDGFQRETVNDAVIFCKGLGFRLIDNVPKKIFGLYNTMKDERVLFFRKDQ